jgi:hypothetical protein
MNSSSLRNFFFTKKKRWAVPPDHPGQNRELCYNLTKELADGKITNHFYTDFYTYPIERAMYMLKGKDAIISEIGTVWFQCGYFQGKEGCETRFDQFSSDWINGCQNVMKQQSKSWKQLLSTIIDISNPSTDHTQLIKACCYNNTSAKAFKKVFVIDGAMDYNFHHFIADELARVARYLPFLRSNPDIMVHIRAQDTFFTQSKQDYEIYLVCASCKLCILYLRNFYF